jgi:osmotically-inducible protein OsmY
VARTSAKVLGLIACLSSFPLGIVLTGCVGDRSHQGTGQAVENSRTAERVREALAATPGYKFDSVKIMAGNGVVQLSGHVKTSAQRTRAGELTGKVAGVKVVLNSLTVED